MAALWRRPHAKEKKRGPTLCKTSESETKAKHHHHHNHRRLHPLLPHSRHKRRRASKPSASNDHTTSMNPPPSSPIETPKTSHSNRSSTSHPRRHLLLKTTNPQTSNGATSKSLPFSFSPPSPGKISASSVNSRRPMQRAFRVGACALCLIAAPSTILIRISRSMGLWP